MLVTSTGTLGLKVDVSADGDPMLFFNLIFTENFVENLVKNTNEYADKVTNASRPLRRRSAWNNWKNVDVDEMKKFIGIIFSMDIIGLHLTRSIGAPIFSIKRNTFLLPSVENDLKQYFVYSILVKDLTLRTIGLAKVG